MLGKMDSALWRILLSLSKESTVDGPEWNRFEETTEREIDMSQPLV
jgi:hypothetical protein